ncbi:MAG: DUF2336 domain-containing protein [Rhodospirillales bacterium]
MNARAKAEAITYEEAKELACDKDAKVRLSLAERQDVKPEILYFLTNDPSPEVRRAIANNPATPRQADLVLASDADEEVRTSIAGKIARAGLDLSGENREKLTEALGILASDQITRVRQILSEALKDMTDAPPEVIKNLALDSEAVVAMPVLEFSTVLNDEDLLEIIEQGPASGGLGAISRRAEVNETVADAIVETDDVNAIADLLSNPSAQLREETLDDLIDRADTQELWHAPLVSRPKLPARAATRLAHFLADNLLETLQAHQDLDTETLEAVKSVVQRRIEGGIPSADIETGPGLDFFDTELPIDMAKRLHKAGKLDQKVIAKALHASDHSFVVAALAVRTDLAIEVIRKIFTAKSSKGILALSWKAGLPLGLAVQVQIRMARIAPEEVLGDRSDSSYPLGEDEMNWQLQFFGDISGGKKG